tara:strand:+ start:943 stop:2925 length:1983 start_codon:yes stop_codon:yes gene_type:complete
MNLEKKKDPSQKEIIFILDLLNSNKLDEAKKEVDKKIINFPESSILYNILGAVFNNQKQFNKSIKSYNKSLEINPNYAQAYNNLGIAYHKISKQKEAIENYKKAITLKKNFSEAYNNLGNAMRDIDKPKDALTNYDKAIKYNSNYAEAYNNIGSTYEMLGDIKNALNNYEKATKIKPNYAEAYNNIGTLLSGINRFDESLLNFKKAISLKPTYEKSYNNLGNLLNDLGKYDEASEAYRKAIQLKPNYPKAYSNLLFNINYKINYNHKLYLAEAQKFQLNCKKKLNNISLKYKYEKSPQKLTVGLVSADFGNHPGGYFTLSTLRELRKKNFNLISYSTSNRKDGFSSYFRPLFSKWNSIEKKNDEEVVQQILNDKVHILLDVQGHSSKNRLPIFFYKPAPIQASWLGQGSTGISEIDYFIGSPHITPKTEEDHYIEKVLRLPEISQCFTPPNFEVEINNLPANKNNFITFGCANKLSKINEEVLILWSEILKSIPGSKIYLKNKNLENPNIAEQFLKKFEYNEIKRERIILLGESSTRKELLKFYNKIDIALDPFPFQGNTSTCEAVWMGVPVLTLKGNRYLFHFGESINFNLGMSEWVADNKEEYISKAIKFSSNLDELSKIRITLKEKALQSPVFNAPRFANNFSDLLWKMWDEFIRKS